MTSEEGGLQTTVGWVLGYSPEYASLEDNPALLAALAEATGGRVLDVYKRQPWPRPKSSSPISVGSVSYTHLDVYKRQHIALGRPAAR